MKLLIPLLSLLLTYGVSASVEPDSSDKIAVQTQNKTDSQKKNKTEKAVSKSKSEQKKALNKLMILNVLLKQKNNSGK